MARFSFHGYYKGWLFRSLRELSAVRLLEKNGQSWATAETAELTVEYIDVYGRKKKHYADLFVDGHTVIEIKPTKYQKSKTVKLKAEAMKAFCKEKGYTYMMISPRKIDAKELKSLVDSGEVTFIESCEKKIVNYLKNRLR